MAIAGRPVARRLGSFLYGRVRKIAQLMGYERIITYTLQDECGASLKAAGARIVGEVEPQEWSVPSRKRKSQAVYRQAKWKWEL